MAQVMRKPSTHAKTPTAHGKGLYKVAGVAALVALATNVLDVVLGFGETEILVNGTQPATAWFALYQDDWFKGVYVLGLLNIVYMAAMMPVYLAIVTAHWRTHGVDAVLVMIVAFLGMAIYISNNAAMPMLVLSAKYAAAGTEAQRALFAAAGEAVLARGEDFTPGAFIGMICGGIAALAISLVMLRGGIFGQATAWVGIVGFTFLSIFTIWATFIPVLYAVAYYFFALIGGLLALTWFALVARQFFKLAQTENESTAQRQRDGLTGGLPT